MSDTTADDRLTAEDINAYLAEHRNWGRWGHDDELGALNLITAEKRRKSAAVVRTGRTSVGRTGRPHQCGGRGAHGPDSVAEPAHPDRAGTGQSAPGPPLHAAIPSRSGRRDGGRLHRRQLPRTATDARGRSLPCVVRILHVERP